MAKTSCQIVLPTKPEIYEILIGDAQAYRAWVDNMMVGYPELFPTEIRAGYTLHDIRGSKKMAAIQVRRIQAKQTDANGKQPTYTVWPSYALPYMMGYTDAVADALFLSSFGVPCWALTRVFGHSEMYWQRLFERLGRYDLVGTTVKQEQKMPNHLVADEKHTRLCGETVYIATTVGKDCVLGVSVSLKADAEHLQEAYGHFKNEARRLAPDYQPETVTLDGWAPTWMAWALLFPGIAIVLCFLHAFLNIRKCARRLPLFAELKTMVWTVYRAETLTEFCEEMGTLYLWASAHLNGTAWEAVRKLCAKTGEFLEAFEHPLAPRTSNTVDRHMDQLARWLDGMRMFHGHLMSAEFQVRAWALIHNFRPYCPRADIRKEFFSPFHRLNDFVYHDNWLQNLLVSTSGQCTYVNHKIR